MTTILRRARTLGFLLFSSLVAAAAGAAGAMPVPPDAAVPPWPKPSPVALPTGSPSVSCEGLELIHSREALGGFEIRVGGKPMAIGQNRPMLAYVASGQLRWLDLARAAQRKLEVKRERDSLMVRFECVDQDGGAWTITQKYAPLGAGPALDVQIGFTVNQERAAAFLPMLMLFPGAGSFGSSKGQALVAGLEYLENEPSSSEADVIGPAAKRQVPDNLKLTFPLMAIQNDGRWLALSWQVESNFCALFDSPDRMFGSGGHVMGVLYPGSNGKNRQEGSLLPLVTETLRAGQSVVLHATLAGGLGDTVVPAIRQYVSSHNLPAIPATRGPQAYISLAAGGWLDSKIREGNLFHHAIAGGSFPAGPAADAAVWMDWLADQTTQPALADRLRTAAQGAIGAVPPTDINAAGVGHVRFPVPSLVYGHVAEAVERARQDGHNLLGRFDGNLAVQYRPNAGGPDYGKTHFSDEASGLTSRPVMDLLEAAAFCGDRELLDAALKRLSAMNKFRNGVPRGAQTWECPLHIPDILASAQMVRAYTLGYELTGQAEWLEQARYWAWTGVPFVYLVNPASEPVGPYATIAVFGATNWKAPIWLGLPVQWCGLVYADALYRLVRDDPAGPWKKLADGITASGVQQGWPTNDTELQGLLPDSFVLRAQHRNGPAINPATVQACAVRLFGPQSPASGNAEVYDFRCFRQNGIRVHAPGSIVRAEESGRRLQFEVRPWPARPYYVLINGLAQKPRLKLGSQPVEITAPHQFQEQQGVLILELKGTAAVELEL